VKSTLIAPALAAALVFSGAVAATADGVRPGTTTAGQNNKGGFDKIRIVTRTARVPEEETEKEEKFEENVRTARTLTVRCEREDERVVGGGVQTDAPDRVAVTGTYPTADRAWTGVTTPFASTKGRRIRAYTITVYAVCKELEKERRQW
jgi:hypothetical protein